jgi:AraC-like DNA-binding protein
MLLTLTTTAQGQTSEGDYQTIDMRDGLTESRIRQIKQTADGRIAIATTGTVDIYDGTRFESYPLPPERVYHLPDYRGGHQMDCDSTGIVWLRNNRTLYAIDTRRHEVVANVDSLLRARGLTADDVTRWKKDIVAKQYGDISDVKSVLHDSYGGLWIGTRENGIRYSNPDRLKQFTTTSEPYGHDREQKFCSPRTSQLSAQHAPDATNCTLDPRTMDYAFIGTRHGVLVFDEKDSLVATIDERYGLSHNNVQSLLNDPRGDVWAATTDGISRIRPTGRDSFDVTNYGRLDGIRLEGREFRDCQIHRDNASGTISVGFAGGTVMFHPDSVKALRYTFHYPDGSIEQTKAEEPSAGTSRLWLFTAALLLIATIAAYIMRRHRKPAALRRQRKAQSSVEQLTSIDETFSRIASEADTRTDDERFLDQLKKTVEEHLGDEDFSVQQLSELMAMERSVLYRRMQALTQMAPSDYIRSVRMSVAARLLRETTMPIADVAYKTGFSTTKYFSRVFKETFGAAPADYRKR